MKQKPQAGETLKEAFALYLWRFKKNALILLPVILFQIYVQHKMLDLIPKLSMHGEAQTFSTFSVMLGWYIFSSIVLFMAYADITRRLLGLPVHLDQPQAHFSYVFWLFKKALTVMVVLFVALFVGALILVAFALTMGFIMRVLGMTITADPPVWLSIAILVVGLTVGLFLITHFTLMCFPIAVDKNEGPIGSLCKGFKAIKHHRQYGLQMAMILLLVAVLPNMIVGSFSTFLAIAPGVSWSKFMFPAFIATSIGDLLALFLICLQLAVYRQLQVDKKKGNHHH